MKQTPIHDRHNESLLSQIPSSSKRVIEIGCSSGALARAFKSNFPCADWVGVEIDSDYAEYASKHCDRTVVSDVEQWSQVMFELYSDRDTWVFGDVLEHLVDPWRVLANIRSVIPPHGSIVSCIPNAQHWSVILKLVTGDFRYEDSGLFDRTHLRWFTRKTILDLFGSQGFDIINIAPRYTDGCSQELIKQVANVARLCGSDPEVTIADILAYQYVVRAVPV